METNLEEANAKLERIRQLVAIWDVEADNLGAAEDAIDQIGDVLGYVWLPHD